MYQCLFNQRGCLIFLGSLLVAAAKFGGHVIGTDIDFLMLHGRTRPTRKQTRVINV